MSLASSPGIGLHVRQTRTLAMTPQLRLALNLLQASNLEAIELVETALLNNPFLERGDETEINIAPTPESEPVALDFDPSAVFDLDTVADQYAPETPWSDGSDTAPEAQLMQAPDLRAHLTQQIRLTFNDQTDRLIASALLAHLEPTGWLGCAPSDLAQALGVDVVALEQIRQTMMRFDPAGLFATSLAECLGAQLDDQNALTPALRILLANLELLAQQAWRRLQSLCGVTPADLAAMVALLRRLNPKPGLIFSNTPLRPLIPDILMRSTADAQGWSLEINPATLPKIMIKHGFYAKLVVRADKSTKQFLTTQMQAATGLVKALESRARTILLVSAEIIRQQDGFFRHGMTHLRPLTLKDVATALELHESTVSRACAGKAIATLRGIFDLKFFFTSVLGGDQGQTHAGQTVKHRIGQLIQAEESQKILSDDAIVALLQKEGIDIARRTVAKYREALRIPGSAQRRRHKNAV